MREKLTFYQQHVIRVLANRGAASATDWGAWYPMGTNQVRGVIYRLANRGLVDVAGFTSSGSLARTYKLTEAGWQAAQELDPEDEE